MGRESRRSHDPNLTSYGTAWQMTRARQVLVLVCLTQDPRIIEWSRAWVDRVTARFAARSPTRREAVQWIFEYFSYGTDISDEDLASLSGLVRDMGVPWVDIPALLFVRLRQLICDGLDPAGASSRKLTLYVDGLKDHPAGRMPRNAGREIERDVVWWYQVNVKEPKTTAYKIAKENGEAGPHSGHFKVEQGIKRAHNLLNSDIRKKGGRQTH